MLALTIWWLVRGLIRLRFIELAEDGERGRKVVRLGIEGRQQRFFQFDVLP